MCITYLAFFSTLSQVSNRSNTNTSHSENKLIQAAIIKYDPVKCARRYQVSYPTSCSSHYALSPCENHLWEKPPTSPLEVVCQPLLTTAPRRVQSGPICWNRLLPIRQTCFPPVCCFPVIVLRQVLRSERHPCTPKSTELVKNSALRYNPVHDYMRGCVGRSGDCTV